jgi:hypothetical protein
MIFPASSVKLDRIEDQRRGDWERALWPIALLPLTGGPTSC